MLSPAAAGFALDAVLGDPPMRLHPVRLMGDCVAYAEARLPRSRAAGIALALLLPSAWGLAAWGLLRLLPAPWAWGLNAALIYFCLAGKDMLVHARAVLSSLDAGDLPAARAAAGRIVGRDTGKLDQAGVSRACVESVAESFCDGLVAPLFFAYLGGAPCALFYKAVSTLDSMVGYKNERYREFGWASARLDDILNFLPARLSAGLVAAVSPSPRAAWACALSDGPSQPSPNSGWPEGAFAGGLGLQLGGPLSYGGVPSRKASLGQALRPMDPEACRAAIGLFRRASFAALILGEALWLLLKA
jgi:adenosylcobinamide-phosphate synthase